MLRDEDFPTALANVKRYRIEHSTTGYAIRTHVLGGPPNGLEALEGYGFDDGFRA
jgi:hypothetical protein